MDSGRPIILCVDDQAGNLQIRAMLLEQFGCATVTACDHRSALRAAADNAVELAIIDYHLAYGETGEEIARDLRVICPRLPLIMLTGDSKLPPSAAEIVDAVLIKGASDPATLLELIQRLLPEAKLRRPKPRLVSSRAKKSEVSGTIKKPEKAS